MINNYLESIRKQFEYYKLLGEKTFAQLSEEELMWKIQPNHNSIAILVNHISGNMKSRWTDFLNSDGEKEWRHRDQEFKDIIKDRASLEKAWESAWIILFEALDSVTQDNFETIVYIRNQGHSIIEAINRQLAHYSYHIGQIVLIGKVIRGQEWQSLSIAKGASSIYNTEKFAQEKSRTHFTDEYLSKEK